MNVHQLSVSCQDCRDIGRIAAGITMATKNIISNSMPTVPIGDALAVKEELSLESAVVTLRKLDGRDKATKLMQYCARFLYWWFATTDPVLSKRAFTLYRTTQRSRKAFRMLKALDEFVKWRHIISAARKTSSSKGLGFLGYTEALLSARHLVMGFFWTFDNLNFLTTTNTVNFGVARATRGFSRSWSVSSALYILLGIESLRKTDKKRRELTLHYAAACRRRASSTADRSVPTTGTGEQRGRRAEESEARFKEDLVLANAEHFKSWLMVLKGALDLTCAVNISGMDIPKRLLGRKLNDGVIGAAGCASALCVLYNNWPARRQQQQQQQ